MSAKSSARNSKAARATRAPRRTTRNRNTGAGAIASGDQSTAVGRGGVINNGNAENIVTDTQIQGDQIAGDQVARDKIEWQINTDGGSYIEGRVNANVFAARDYIVQQVDGVDWNKVDFAPHLGRVISRFVSHLVRGRDTNDPKALAGLAERRYLPLMTSERRAGHSPLMPSQRQEGKVNKLLWDEAAPPPCLGLLVGEAHSGKTTSLLRRAQKLALQAIERADAKEVAKEVEGARQAVIPIYFSASGFVSGMRTAEALLDMAASACGLEPRVLRKAWYEERRSICLLIDGADEVPSMAQGAFVEALLALVVQRKNHSIIVSSRPGELYDELYNELLRYPDFVAWVLLPLESKQVETLLANYDLASLWPWFQKQAKKLNEANGAAAVPGSDKLSEGSLDFIKKPGWIINIARSLEDAEAKTLPNSPFDIYHLLEHKGLFDVDVAATDLVQATDKYDYWRVKRPLLSFLAYEMLCQGQASLEIDDALCRQVKQRLSDCFSNFDRSRSVMPEKWSAESFLKDLTQLPVLSGAIGTQTHIQFANPTYRSYYASIYLQNLSEKDEKWNQVIASAKQRNPEPWIEVMIWLAGQRTNRNNMETLIDQILSSDRVDAADIAADIWIERRPPELRAPACLYHHFQQQKVKLDRTEHSAQAHLWDLLAHQDPRVRLNAVSGLSQLGLGAVAPLLEAVESNHCLIQSVAIHALLHLGQSLANPTQSPVPPLISLHKLGRGFSVQTGGTCNISLGNLKLVDVPPSFKAELQANFKEVDFDLFEMARSAKIGCWHSPIVWFALDYFKRFGVDWIDLAQQCLTVAKTAECIYDQAHQKPALRGLASELAHCAATYDLMGFCITKDLGIPWRTDEANANVPKWQLATALVEEINQSFIELRWLFSRSNRTQTLRPENRSNKSLKVQQNAMEMGVMGDGDIVGIHIDEINLDDGNEGQIADVPPVQQINWKQNVNRLKQGDVNGLHISRATPNAYLAAETLVLNGQMNIAECADSRLSGIVIDQLNQPEGKQRGWRGIRATLQLNIAQLSNSQITGIRVQELEGQYANDYGNK